MIVLLSFRVVGSSGSLKCRLLKWLLAHPMNYGVYIYIYIYIHVYIHIYICIYIYIYMADSPDQRQLKLQKATHFTNEMTRAYPTNRTSIGVTSNKHTPHYWVCFLGELRGIFRGYASGVCFGVCGSAPPFEEPNKSIRTYQIERFSVITAQPLFVKILSQFKVYPDVSRKRTPTRQESIPRRNTHARGYVFFDVTLWLFEL